MGKNDEETMVDMTKKKPILKKKTTGNITAVPKTVDANQTDTQSVGASSVGMGSIAGHSKTCQAQQEVLDETNVLIKESNKKLEDKLEKAAKSNAKKDKKIAKMEKQLAMILAQVNIADDEENESDDDGEEESEKVNTSSQGSGQQSGEGSGLPDGSIFVPDLGTTSDPPPGESNDAGILDVEKELEKYPSDISADEPYVSTDEEENEDLEASEDPIEEAESVGASTSSSDSSSDDSSSSTSDNNDDDDDARLPLIPSHKHSVKPKMLETKFDTALESTGGDPGPPT